jgi:hypothetical protein
MKITIVTLYRAGMCEHYVGAVEGELTDEQRTELANNYEAVYDLHGKNLGAAFDAADDDDELDQISFREVELQSDPSGLKDLLNIDDTKPEARS